MTLLNLKKYEKIYFVCSGNIIRSALSELYLDHLLDDRSNVSIRSFGTTYHNTTIHYKAKEFLTELGISTGNFTPTHISEISLDDESIVFGMTKEHLHLINIQWEGFLNSYLLSEVNNEIIEIADPYFANNQELAFKKAFEQIVTYVDNIYNEIG